MTATSSLKANPKCRTAYEAAEEGVRAATEKRNAAKAMLEAALDKTEAEAAAAEQ